MAKQNGNGNAAQKPSDAAPKFQRPVGYHKAAVNVDQFWCEEDGPIHAILKSAKPYTNKLNGRLNVIYIFELVEECSTESSKGEKFERKATRGEIVGVWGSPGMRELKGLGGCKIWMAREGEKDLGRPGQKPMKTYDVVYQGNPVAVRMIRADDTDGEQSQRAAQAGAESDAYPF